MHKKPRLLQTFKNKITQKGFQSALPLIYISGVIVSIILTLLILFFPALVICPTVLGVEFCAPLGVYTALILSFPGYLLAGGILSTLTIPWYLSLLLIVLISLGFYYVTGFLIEKVKKEKLSQNAKVILSIFLFLVGAFFALSVYSFIK